MDQAMLSTRSPSRERTDSGPVMGRVNSLAEETYIELVRNLFDTLLPTIIMAGSFTAVGFSIVFDGPTGDLMLLFGLGCSTALCRIAVLLVYRRAARDPVLTVLQARRMERQFQLAYLSFAIFFGLFAGVAFAHAALRFQIVTVALVFGYGTGVAAGLSVRPQISIPSITIATIPMLLVSLYLASLPNLLLGALLTVFLGGGIHAIWCRYKIVSTRLTTIVSVRCPSCCGDQRSQRCQTFRSLLSDSDWRFGDGSDGDHHPDRAAAAV